MPEIAEVEIQRRGLETLFRRQKLTRVEMDPRLGAAHDAHRLAGQRLQSVLRHGKLLGLQFDQDVLAVHLRMTGGFFLQERPHIRARFFFDKPLFFADSRRFATIDWVDPWSGVTANLGPDLWMVSAEWLPLERFRFSRRAIKTTILDQRVVAGIGNYLADESLHRARISPFVETASLSDRDWEKIISAAQELSREVLARGGVSLRDYKDLYAQDGGGESLLRVYGKGGSPCQRCGAILRKDRLGGRGTTWCASCQG